MSLSTKSNLSLNSPRDGESTTSLGNPFQCLTTLSEKKCLLISSLNLAQLKAIPSCPITGYLGEDTNPQLPTPSFQVVVESNKVSPELPLLQTKQPQFPQSLPIRPVFQTLHQFCSPSLDMVQGLNVFLEVRGPKVNTVLDVRPHQSRVQGDDHLPSPAGYTIPDTSQDAAGLLLGHLGTLPVHVQLSIDQHSQILFLCIAFQPLCPEPIVSHGVVVTKVKDLALSHVEPHPLGLCPAIQPVQVPLQGLPTLQQTDTSPQLGVICKLPEGALNSLIQIINKGIKEGGPQHRLWRNTTHDRLPAGFHSVHHLSLGLAIQPVSNPAKSVPVQAMCCQLLQENTVGDRVKGFAEVRVDRIHSLSLIHQVGHLVIEGDEVGQAGLAFHEPMLAGPDPQVDHCYQNLAT